MGEIRDFTISTFRASETIVFLNLRLKEEKCSHPEVQLVVRGTPRWYFSMMFKFEMI